MNREELDQLMLLYACGGAEESDIVRAEGLLASGDADAQAAYAEALAVVNAIPLGLERREPPRRVRDEVMQRVLAGGSARTPQHGSSSLYWWGGAVAAVVAVALTLTVLDRNRLARELALRDAHDKVVNRVMESPQVTLAKLEAQSGAGASGRVLFCPIRREYEVKVFRMAPPPAGRVYELWFVTTDDRKIPGGTFEVDEFGNATVTASSPKGATVSVAAISDEPVGGSEKPTGAMHLIGKLQ